MYSKAFRVGSVYWAQRGFIVCFSNLQEIPGEEYFGVHDADQGDLLWTILIL